MNNLLAVNISGFSSWLDTSSYNSADTLINGKIVDGINYFVGFSALVAVILLIVAGYSFITSAGDPDKVDKAGKIMTGAIIGMAIVFLARILVQLVLDTIAQ